MFNFYVYEHKHTDSFRVVIGEHKAHSDRDDCTLRVYQGQTKQAAIDAAYSGETRVDIRGQIARFHPTITRPGSKSAGAAEVRMKPSEFLTQYTDSHAIQDHEKLAALYLEKTGRVAVWPARSHQETTDTIKARGLGGELAPDTGVKLCYGYEMAASIARELCGYYSPKMGRGFRFRDCIDVLQKAGY